MQHAHRTESKRLTTLVQTVVGKAKAYCQRSDEPSVVVSPYRFNPLGAHIDHQGGDVLARTIDQYTVFAFYPSPSGQFKLACEFQTGEVSESEFRLGQALLHTCPNWQRYAMASAMCMHTDHSIATAVQGYVQGTLVGAGLSSSASVILAYVCAMAQANQLSLAPASMVGLVSHVENNYMGLNNGIQDQMSIVFGQNDGLSLLNVGDCTNQTVSDNASIDAVSWVLFYSGFSRELISSGFNDRVRECREAANLLDSQAQILGQVALPNRRVDNTAKLPAHLSRRVTHVYGEMQRVSEGVVAWRAGQYERFGQLMNASCNSSINNYECGSEPMIALQQLALNEACVLGSRFSGGGYGGCLTMLVRESESQGLEERLTQQFVTQFPEKKGIAHAFRVESERGVRVLAS